MFSAINIVQNNITHRSYKTHYMNELINRLVTNAGITPEQAQKAVETIAGFVKEKFPMLGGAVDQVFAAGSAASDE